MGLCPKQAVDSPDTNAATETTIDLIQMFFKFFKTINTCQRENEYISAYQKPGVCPLSYEIRHNIGKFPVLGKFKR